MLLVLNHWPSYCPPLRQRLQALQLDAKRQLEQVTTALNETRTANASLQEEQKRLQLRLSSQVRPATHWLRVTCRRLIGCVAVSRFMCV